MMLYWRSVLSSHISFQYLSARSITRYGLPMRMPHRIIPTITLHSRNFKTMVKFLFVLVLFAPVSSAFVNQPRNGFLSTSTGLAMSTPDPERMKQILKEEATNPQSMKATAQAMKNLKPEDIDKMLRDMDNMPAAQREQMKAMGMNLDMMRQSMEMMKANPEMAQQMAQMMDKMTPEEMLEKSRQAQAAFASVGTPVEDAAPAIVDAQVESSTEDDDDDDEEAEDAEPIPLPDAETLDTLFRTAELMSSPPTGKVTLQGFATIPPIALLTGDDPERDLSKKELAECWADGSLGSTRVDRAGFERVWEEVQEYFSLPLMDKARERSLEKSKKRGGSKPQPVTSSTTPATPQVGASISPEQLEQQVKSMSDSDMDAALEQMKDMTPEQEARMKAMGVDPAMMRKTASLLNSNPMMKNAAKMMMKTMSPEQMKKASQQAQEQMKNMSPEDIQKAMDELEKQSKQ